MAKPSLFISHSTAALPETERSRCIRESLYGALVKQGWEPFLDAEVIQAGNQWRSTILCNLAAAQAGVILFNERAISESKWVAAEALILCFRKSLDPDFQVIPVMLDGKKLSDTCFANYEPFQLNEIQAIEDDTDVSPEEFAERISTRLNPELVRGPVNSHWVHRVVSLLANVEPEAILLAAEQLQVSASGSALEAGVGRIRRALVELMHHSPPEDSVGAFQTLVPQLDERQASQFSRLLASKWVANESVETLMCVARGNRTDDFFTLNTNSQEVIQEYLNRLKIEFQGRTVWAFSVSAGAGEGDGSIITQVERAIRAHLLGPSELLGGDCATLSLSAAVGRIMGNCADVAICTLPAEYAKRSVLTALCASFPRIFFIVQTGMGGATPGRLGELGGKVLPPPITPERHNSLLMLKARLRAAISAAQLD